MNNRHGIGLELELRHMLGLIWNVPSKVCIFGWRLLVGRLQSQDALLH